jgi:hypothetical protein
MDEYTNYELKQSGNLNCKASTYTQSCRSLPLQFINRVDNVLQRYGGGITNLSAEHLLNKAVRKMGLSDWGVEDFQEPLRKLVDCLDQESHLDFLGRLLFENWIFNSLCNRLCIQDEIKDNPAIMQEEIRRPLFIVSLPRTGTTLLHNLLCLDPDIRFLRAWEVVAPALHPKFRANKVDNREKQLKLFLWLLERLAPDFVIAHELKADGPDECAYLLWHTFTTEGIFDGMGFFQAYVEWQKMADKLPSYLYYRKILQLLQTHQSGDHWVLKAPMHLASLDTLLKAFPDACIVQIHRDPSKAFPSVCSLTAIGTQHLTGARLDLSHIGRIVTEQWICNLEKALDVRKRSNPVQFLDVQYHEVMRNPHGTVRKIYDYFGYPYGAHMDRRITLWLARNKQHKKGVHKYSADQFGLSIPEIRERTLRYIQAYEISCEN